MNIFKNRFSGSSCGSIWKLKGLIVRVVQDGFSSLEFRNWAFEAGIVAHSGNPSTLQVVAEGL
jgi:hypothetical protein